MNALHARLTADYCKRPELEAMLLDERLAYFAMHEAEKALPDLGLYFEHLDRICRQSSSVKFASPGVWSVHATAAQRARAFLKTISLWNDNE